MSKEKKIPLKKVMTGDRGFQQLEMKKEKTEGKKRMVDFQYYLGSAPHAPTTYLQLNISLIT
jgi:hypothetical protein